MGLLDHKKQWQFELKASPDDCNRAFITAMSGGKLKFRKLHWTVSNGQSDAGNPLVVATNQGRGQFAALATAMSKNGQAVETAGIGSQMSFEVADHDPKTGMTRCALWMSNVYIQLGFFTAEAGYFRSYMNDVARNLAALDPNMRIAKA